MELRPDTGSLESFSRDLDGRVHAWLATEEARGVAGAELYRHLPALFCLLARLALDPRVPPGQRRGLLAAVKYVVAPFDLIPEGVLGTAGFRDDLVLAAYTVHGAVAALGSDLVNEHWTGEGCALDVSREILDAATRLVGPEVCERLRAWAPEGGQGREVSA